MERWRQIERRWESGDLNKKKLLQSKRLIFKQKIIMETRFQSRVKGYLQVFDADQID